MPYPSRWFHSRVHAVMVIAVALYIQQPLGMGENVSMKGMKNIINAYIR